MDRRIVVIGTSCSGKSTLSKRISQNLSIPHYELDNYYWESNWTSITEDKFIQIVKDFTSKNNWVICGNYSAVRDIIWDKSTDIVWIDYPFYLVFYRAIKRSIIRAYKKEKVCNGNVESFKKTFMTKDSIILWVLNTYFKRKKEYRSLLLEVKGKRIHQLKNQKATDKFVKTL